MCDNEKHRCLTSYKVSHYRIFPNMLHSIHGCSVHSTQRGRLAPCLGRIADVLLHWAHGCVHLMVFVLLWYWRIWWWYMCYITYKNKLIRISGRSILGRVLGRRLRHSLALTCHGFRAAFLFDWLFELLLAESCALRHHRWQTLWCVTRFCLILFLERFPNV